MKTNKVYLYNNYILSISLAVTHWQNQSRFLIILMSTETNKQQQIERKRANENIFVLNNNEIHALHVVAI